MSTALTLYGVPSFTTTLSTATSALANTSGASSLGHDTSIGSHTGYGELYPQGNTGTWPSLGSIPAPTGNGYLFDDVSLEGQTIALGNWTPTVRLRVNGGTGGVTADLYVRAYKRSSSGVYTLIGTMQLLAQSIANGTSANYTFAATSLPAMAFATGDKLYYDVWANITSAASGAANLRLDLSSSTSQGSTNDQLVTPGYDVTPTGTQNTRNASGRFKLTLPHASTLYGSGRFVSAVRRARDTAGRFRMRAPRTRFGSGRFTLFAAPPPPLAAVAGSTFVPIMQNPQVGGIPTFAQRVDDRATGSFVVLDQGMNYNLSENQRISINDSVAGRVLYTGFVDQVVDQLMKTTTSVQNMRTVTLKDLRWLAEKKIATTDYAGWTAGDIAAELHRTLLAPEGLTAPYALRHDMDGASFSAGTLSSVVANPATGALELAKAGTSWTKVETTTSDFGAGTLTNVSNSNNQLTLTSYKAVKLSGTAGKSVGFNAGNMLTYWTIWTGSQGVASGDYLEYDIWISSTSADLSGGVELRCSDGSSLKDSGSIDQYGLSCHPQTSLSGYATDQWMHRRIVVQSGWSGKSITSCKVALEGDKDGPYTIYIKGVNFRSSGNTLKTAFFSTALQKSSQSSNVGYINVKLTAVTVYAQSGSRISPAYGAISASLTGNSLITWTQSIPVQPTSTASTQNVTAPLTVETSLDGGVSWQLCTNHAAIPSLLVGENLSGKTLTLRETLNVAGPNPELSPVLTDVTMSIDPAYLASKTDVLHADTASAMTTGTITNSGYQAASDPPHDASGYVLAGHRKRWNWANFADTTQFTGLVRACINGNLGLPALTGADCRLRFDGATYSSVALEVDMQVANFGTNGGIGVLYRTTNWDSGANTFGYHVYASMTQLVLGKGSNSGTGAFTFLQTVTIAATSGQWVHLKVVCGSDNVHHVLLDDVEYITFTDSSYTAAGQVGLRFYNNTAGTLTGYYDNFGVSASSTLTGSRVAPSVAIGASGIVENSAIWWNADTPPGCTLDIQASVDGGASYISCTNGGVIPGCEVGVDVTGKSLLTKTVLTTGSLSLTPILYGLSWLVVGNFAASGSRIAPVLDATPAGVVGASSVTWQAITPPGTAAFIDSSLDGTTFTNVPVSGGSVAGLTSQGALWWDTFDSVSSASYTYTVASWLWDITNSRLATQGTTFTDLLLTGLSTADVEVYFITNQIQDMSILLRQAASNNRYTLPMSDTSGISGGNIDLHRVTPGGGDVLVAHGAINFVRGTYHAIRVTLAGSTFNVYFDGILLYTYTDPTPITGAGSVGLNRGTGTSYVNDLAIRPLGVSASGKTVYTKVRLTSSDPLQTPSVPDLLASVRGPALATGAVIPQTQHAYKDTVAAFIDDIAKQSNLSWRFNESYQFSMTDRFGTFAPFVIATVNQNIDGVTQPPTVTRFSPLYRNKQYITGAVDLATVTEPKIGDGVTQSWGLSYPVDSMQSIMLNGGSQSFGIQGVDTGRVFYYQQGSNTLTVDASLTPPASTFLITYTGQVPYRAMAQDTGQQAIIAALDGSSGIVEMSEDAAGLTRAAADALAQSRITQYSRLSLDWKFPTQQNGLAPGQLLTVIVPEHGLNDLQFLITEVSAAVYADTNGNLLYWNTVSTTTGPSLGNWSRKLQAALLKG